MTEQTHMPACLIDDLVRRAALRTLELARETDMWDIVPLLGLVVDDGEEPLCVHVPVPDSMWHDAGHPANVLRTIAAGIATGIVSLQLTVDPGMVRGVVLITEGHTVDDENLTDAERATLDDFRKNHRVEEHPKARELRMAEMIDRSLTHALVRHFRGDEVSDKVIYGISGSIPKAMEELVTTLMSAWMADSQKTP